MVDLVRHRRLLAGSLPLGWYRFGFRWWFALGEEVAVWVLAVFQVVPTGIGERGMPAGASPTDLHELACGEGSCGQPLRIGGLTVCWLGGEPSQHGRLGVIESRRHVPRA